MEKKQILNVARDRMSQVTTLPMQKHEGLSLHIHKQTRSEELTRMMSKFCYSIGYDDTQRYIGTFPNQVDQQTLQNGIFVPPNLAQGKFLHCALDKLDFSENTKSGTTMHATTQNVYQYQGTNREHSIAFVPVQTNVRQRTLPNSENFIAPELHIGQKERKTTRSVSDVPLTEHQAPNKCIIEDESIVSILFRLLQVREDIEKDGTGVEPLSWNQFCEVMADEVKATFTRDRICSDPFGIGSTLFAWDRFETGMVRFHIGSHK